MNDAFLKDIFLKVALIFLMYDNFIQLQFKWIFFIQI